MHNNMHSSAVNTVFCLPLLVLHFIANPCSSGRLGLNLKSFCSKFGNNCSEHDIITNNNLHVQNSNIKFGIVPILPISYTWSICRQKQHINGENSSKQAYKIWHKNFQPLPSVTFLVFGHSLAAPCICTCSLFSELHNQLALFLCGSWACYCVIA